MASPQYIRCSGTQEEGCHMPQRECIASWGACPGGHGPGPWGPHPPRPSLISDLIKDFSLSSTVAKRILLQPKAAHGLLCSRPLLHFFQRKSQKVLPWPRRPYRTRLHHLLDFTSCHSPACSLSTPALLVSSLYLKYVPGMLLPQGLCTDFPLLSGSLFLYV